LIGMFVNTLAVRVHWEPNATLEDLLAQTHNQVMMAKANQDLPFEQLIDKLNVERDPSRNPIFQVMFSLQRSGGDTLVGSGGNTLVGSGGNTVANQPLALEQVSLNDDAYSPAKFDLSLFLNETMSEDRTVDNASDGIGDSGENSPVDGMINYATTLFSRAKIEAFIAAYQKVLQSFADSVTSSHGKSALETVSDITPTTLALTSINVLAEQERTLLLDTLNQTEQDYPKQATLHALFQQQVTQTPDTLALVFGDEQLSYAELDARANQLAHAIRNRYHDKYNKPLPRDTFIGLHLDRSVAMVVSMLAVLKAGAAYVPVSPAFPDERLEFILYDTQTPMLLVNQAQSRKINRIIDKLEESPLVIVADDPQSYADQPSDNPASETLQLAQPNDLAYVIYTSGTTGMPKGVMIEHRGVVDLMVTQGKRFYADRCQHALLFASYVFDATILEVFYALSYGMTAYLCAEEERNAEAVTRLIKTHQIDYAFLPPVIIKQLVGEQFPSLKVLATGGEAPSAEFMDYFSQQCTVINAYGPTEFTVTATMHEYQSGDSATCIGRATENTKLYVLDEHQQPVPMGVVGELYVSGVGMARGYLHRPELNESAFIPNAFASEQDKANGFERLYRTGDLVRYVTLSDTPTGEPRTGAVEYMGRKDTQVKIRGYRIELGEVETCLADIVGTGKAVVIDRKRDDMPYLAAYVIQPNKIQAGSEKVDADTLLAEMSKRLPEYMLPATFTAIDAIPLTLSGKLDRRALPEPEWADSESYVAPRTELESKMVDVWRDVLNQDQVGVEDNFFRIGGDSISAVRVMSAIKQQTNLDVPIGLLFRAPSIAALIKEIDQNQSLQSLVKHLTPDTTAEQKMFMIHAAGCGSEVYDDLSAELASHFDCYGIDNYHHTSQESIPVMSALAKVYMDLILEITSVDEPIRLLGWSLGGILALDMARQLEAAGAKDVKVVLLDTVLYDEHLLAIRKQIDDSTVLDMYRSELDAAGIGKELANKMVEAYEIEMQFSFESPAGQLQHTEIMLFKACMKDPQLEQFETGQRLNEELQLCFDNNIFDYSEKQLAIVNVDCTHSEIILNVPTIRTNILKRFIE